MQSMGTWSGKKRPFRRSTSRNEINLRCTVHSGASLLQTYGTNCVRKSGDQIVSILFYYRIATTTDIDSRDGGHQLV